MRYTDQCKLDCAQSVLGFCRRLPDLSPAGSSAIIRLQRLVTQAGVLLEQQRAALGEAAAALAERQAIAVPLKQRLAHLVRLAQAAAVHEGEVTLRLRIPFGASRQGEFLSAARAATGIATSYRALLQRYGMPAPMLAELGSDLERYEEAQRRRANAQAAAVAATADLATVAREALMAIRHLDALQRLRFAADPELLAEWQAVRSVRWERPRGRPREDSGNTTGEQRGWSAA